MSDDLDNLVRVTKSQAKAAGNVLAQAFADYPLHVAFIPDGYERKKKSPYFLEVFVRYGILYGVVYATSPKLEGVIVWLPSENADYAIWKMIRSGMLSYLFKIGIKTILRMISVGNFLNSLHKRYAPFRHWYGWYVGVNPEFQGKGYGKILIEAMLAIADKDKLPCYGETHTLEDVALWERYGFKVIDESTLPGTEFKQWVVLRDKVG